MKSTCIFLLSFISVIGLQVSAANIGEPAPNFSLKNTAGETVTLEEYAGKLVVLEWTNHECPFVKKHYNSGNMQTLQKNYSNEDVVWLSIISSAPGKQGHISGETADELTNTRNATPSHVLFDPEGTTGRQYKAKTTPHMYVIGKEGKLLYNGAIDSIKSADPADIPKANNYVDQTLKEIMAGKQISKPLTRPYGCSIKYG